MTTTTISDINGDNFQSGAIAEQNDFLKSGTLAEHLNFQRTVNRPLCDVHDFRSDTDVTYVPGGHQVYLPSVQKPPAGSNIPFST